MTGDVIMAAAELLPEPRWKALVHYRSSLGPIEVQHDIEELEELQDLIERGPDWRTIERMEVVLVRGNDGDMQIGDEP